ADPPRRDGRPCGQARGQEPPPARARGVGRGLGPGLVVGHHVASPWSAPTPGALPISNVVHAGSRNAVTRDGNGVGPKPCDETHSRGGVVPGALTPSLPPRTP